MSIVRLCAIGNLEIELNLILRESEAKYFKFDISKINKPIDLKQLFFSSEDTDYDEEKVKINYFDYISLSSKNEFITTLLFINRAFKNKTFVELIMLNQMEFSYETSFLKGIIRQICVKNYFFLVENKIFNTPTSIKFNIKILKDDNDEVISSKSFELFEQNVEIYDDDENNNLNLFDKINYNFDNTQFFLANFSDIVKYKKEEYEEISLFYKNLISGYSNIKIISIFNDNCINHLSEIEYIDLFKDIISYSDYIFSDKNLLNHFYNYYNKIYDNNIINYEKLDLILKDREKKRKSIEILTILMEDLNYFQIYIQKGTNMDMIYNESFSGK